MAAALYHQIDSNKRKTILLIFLFTGVVLAVGWAYGIYTDTGYGGLVFAAAIAFVMSLTSYYKGDAIALASSGAKEIQKTENPYVYRMVENAAITVGLPMPRVHIIHDPMINAFATGRDPEHASIAVTTGAIEKLENEELEGVLAHEMAHIKNYDIRVMMIVLVLVGIIALLSDIFMRSMMFGGNRKRDNNAGGILMIVGLVLLIVSPLIAKIIQLAISRKREYLADASGALITRYPEGLARALEKIRDTNTQPLAKASNATAHLFFANPFGGTKKFLSNAFSTHPPIDDRINKLRQMA